jgi:hypothetical protein
VAAKELTLRLDPVGVSVDLRAKAVYHVRTQSLTANVDLNDFKPTW